LCCKKDNDKQEKEKRKRRVIAAIAAEIRAPSFKKVNQDSEDTDNYDDHPVALPSI